MISAINSSDNKRHITIASIGGIAWGAKEAYNTRINLSAQKNSFKKILKNVFYNKNYNEALDGHLNKQAEYFQNIGAGYFSDKEKLANKEFYNKVKELIENTKQETRNNIKKIKKYAPFKITAKTIGGAAIGFGISCLFSYIKDKNK